MDMEAKDGRSIRAVHATLIITIIIPRGRAAEILPFPPPHRPAVLSLHVSCLPIITSRPDIPPSRLQPRSLPPRLPLSLLPVLFREVDGESPSRHPSVLLCLSTLSATIPSMQLQLQGLQAAWSGGWREGR